MLTPEQTTLRLRDKEDMLIYDADSAKDVGPTIATYTQSFYLGSRFLASVERPKYWLAKTQYHPSTTLFVCPLCLEVWLRAVVPNTFPETYVRPCDQHSPQALAQYLASCPTYPAWEHFIPGSVYLFLNDAWNDSLPLELLAREFLLLHKEP